MQLSNIPGKLVLPFANAGGKSTIPVASQIGITAGAASLTDGFPPLTRTPIAAGGVPPSGLDMNGILYEMSAIIRWANAGGGYPFDGTFAADSNVGGYPKGARIMRSDGLGYWFNTTDNNVTDPEGAGAVAAGWVPDFTSGVSAITMTGSSVTLTPLQYGKPVIVITGVLTANLNLIFPSIADNWIVINNTTGAYSITAKTAAGTGVYLGTVTPIFGDGVNIYSALAALANTTDMLQGVALVGGASRVVNTITALKALPKTGSQSAFVLGYYASGDGGGGPYYYDSTDITSADNGGTIIVATDGGRWKLAINRIIDARQFGIRFNGNQAHAATNQAQLQVAVDWMTANYYGGTLWLEGTDACYVSAVTYTRDDGSTAFGATSVKLKDGVNIDGHGTIKVQDNAYGAGAFYRVFSSRDATMLSNSSIRNITVDGNRANQTASTQCSNIVLECLANVEVTGVKSINANGNGIMLRGTTAIFATALSVRGCNVQNCSSIGIQSSQFDGLTIADNIINGTTDNNIDIYGEDGTTTCHGLNFAITGNVCKSGLVGVFMETVRNGVCSGNEIYNCTLGITVNRINGQPNGINVTGNSVDTCQYGMRVTGDTAGIAIRANAFKNFTVAGVQLGEGGGNCSYVDVSDNFLQPATNTTACIATGGAVASFITGRFNTVNSNGITAGYVKYLAATTNVVVTIHSFKVIPGQVGNDLYADDPLFAKLTLLGGLFDNVGPGNNDIAVDDYTGGTLHVTASQGGVGHSTWIVPFVKHAGTLVLGTPQTVIISADPIGSITVSAGSARVATPFANTYLRYSLQYTPVQ